MGRLVACAVLCLILVVPIFAQPEPATPPSVVIDNLTNYPVEFTHHYIYRDGSFSATETRTLASGARMTLLVDDPEIAKVLTTCAMVRPEPLPGLWNQNNSWSILEDGGPEDSTFWTLDDQGFWLADYDPIDNPDIQQVLMCNWRTTAI